MSQLFVVRARNGMWWDSTTFRGRRIVGDRWTRELGIACLFTRRAVADKLAIRTGARVFELVPTEASR